jgi:DNA-binding response OmpR family regulator
MKKRRILVVDDDPTYRQLVTLHLTKAGYEVFIATDGQQALEWLGNEHQRPDLLLVDLLMPRLSGIELLERIRGLSYKLPVIMITGADWLLARQGVQQSAPDAFLTKPFTVQLLLEQIEELLPI